MKFVSVVGRSNLAGSVQRTDSRAREPKVVSLARRILEDRRALTVSRETRAYELCKDSVKERGGMLQVVSKGRKRVVEGEVRVPAGPEMTNRLVETDDGCMKVSVRLGLDERVVDAVQGYGMGTLDVSYMVDKDGNTEYVLRTNGSMACLESNKVNVAMALIGAAEILEEMLQEKQEQAKPRLELVKKAA
jgi:hypothetical protein